jgi:glycosyltransferase involved in cell wall biosynthesis
MSKSVAIVIPAYKSEYIDQALGSLVNQTNRNFKVYIGDDAGPLNISEIVNGFRNKLDIKYHRFGENIGQKDLVAQWERCISLTDNEEYIWFFSDDDFIPEDAVERLKNAIRRYPDCDLFRFNIRQIDEKGTFLSEPTDHPELESSEEFIRRRIAGVTLSAACEYIFRMDTYVRNGGFVDFPMAWCSDDSTWSLIGRINGIVTIPGDPVLWRISGINISRPGHKNKEKFIATLQYYEWLKKNHFLHVKKQLLSMGLRRQTLILDVSMMLFIIYSVRILSVIGICETITTGYVLFKSKLTKKIK